MLWRILKTFLFPRCCIYSIMWGKSGYFLNISLWESKEVDKIVMFYKSKFYNYFINAKVNEKFPSPSNRTDLFCYKLFK